MVQQASQTFVSRARNSSSLKYHALAAVFSNGVWFVNQFIILDQIYLARKSGSWPLIIATLVYYIAFTVAGSVASHQFLMKRVERRIA